MSWYQKQEFEPLLPLGFHRKSLTELRALCVEAEGFALSRTRGRLMDNLTMILRRLDDSWVVGEAWIDGSFLTKKIDPDDVDLSVIKQRQPFRGTFDVAALLGRALHEGQYSLLTLYLDTTDDHMKRFGCWVIKYTPLPTAVRERTVF